MAQPQRVRSITRDLTAQFGFASIKVYPDECLGTGAYGAVCKAMCDELPCAAKLLHSVLFQFNDPGMPAMMRRFQQECELMGRIRHPCIVQYLGTVEDPESHRPILLMELMDESLTKFLERLNAPVTYHIQINLSYDIALALAYLHSNGVVHRDLSSNNVLITAGSRAKVTDFGMLKLLEQNMRMTPLTKCPGTVAYMPPETLSDDPVYTDKLDCFSLGVLMIQIITRNFPEPTKATVTVHDPKYPTGRVLVPVPEVERRKKDIDLLDNHHSMKSISLSCLNDIEKQRPSAQDLCHQLASLREDEQFRRSMEQMKLSVENHERLREENHILREDYQRLEKTHQNLEERVRKEHHTLREDYERLKQSHQHLEEQLEIARKKIADKEAQLDHISRTKDSEIEVSRQQLQDKVRSIKPPLQRNFTLKWEEVAKVKCPFGVIRGAACATGTVAYFNPGGAQTVYCYDYQTKQWSELPNCPSCGFALVIINDVLTTVGGVRSVKLFSFIEGKWVKKYPPMTTKRYWPSAVCTGHSLVVVGGRSEGCDLRTVEVMDTNTLQWFLATSLPRVIFWASMTICCGDLYLFGDNSTHVYSCSLKALLESCHAPGKVSTSQQENVWKRINDLPILESTAATLCGQVISVGGRDSGRDRDDLCCYDPITATWKSVGQTPVCRGLPLVATLPNDKLLFVYGTQNITIYIASAVMN